LAGAARDWDDAAAAASAATFVLAGEDLRVAAFLNIGCCRFTFACNTQHGDNKYSTYFTQCPCDDDRSSQRVSE